MNAKGYVIHVYSLGKWYVFCFCFGRAKARRERQRLAYDCGFGLDRVKVVQI